MLHGFSDSDWAGSAQDRKSTSEFYFSSSSTMVSWSSKKQGSVALSTAESEYIFASDGSREVVWLRKLLSYLFDSSLEPVVIHCENQSCVKLLKNLVFHDRSKHIKIRYHYVWNMVQRKAVKLRYIPTYEQIVDVLTKPLSKTKFEHFRDKLGVVENASLAEREC